MKTSLSNVSEERAESALTTIPEGTVAPVAGLTSQFQGDVDKDDMIVPYLAVVQKTGTLGDDFPFGHFVLDKQHDLGDSISAIFVNAQKFFEEKRPFGAEGFPERWDTKAEAVGSGLEYLAVANLDLLIEVEEDSSCAEQALFTFNGKAYAAARYTVRSTSYGRVYKVLVNDVRINKAMKNPETGKPDLACRFYSMATEKKAVNGNTFWFPQMKLSDAVPSELRHQITEQFGV